MFIQRVGLSLILKMLNNFDIYICKNLLIIKTYLINAFKKYFISISIILKLKLEKKNI